MGTPESSKLPPAEVRVDAKKSWPWALTVIPASCGSARPLTTPFTSAPAASVSCTSWLSSPVRTASAGALVWSRRAGAQLVAPGAQAVEAEAAALVGEGTLLAAAHEARARAHAAVARGRERHLAPATGRAPESTLPPTEPPRPSRMSALAGASLISTFVVASLQSGCDAVTTQVPGRQPGELVAAVGVGAGLVVAALAADLEHAHARSAARGLDADRGVEDRPAGARLEHAARERRRPS